MLCETARSPGTPWLEEEKLDFLTFAPMKGALSHSSSQIVNFRGERVSAGRESSTEHVRRKLSTLPRSNYLQMCSETLLDPYLILNIHSDMSAGSGAKNPRCFWWWSDPAPLCVFMYEGVMRKHLHAAALVLLVLLIKEESSALKPESHHIQQLPRLLVDCGRNFSRDKLKSPVRRWPLVVAVIMTTAKKEVRWSRTQRECVQVSWRPSARYSNSYITSLHQDESALTSVRWNDWSVEDLRSARWHNGFRSLLAVSLIEVFIPSHLHHIVLIILCPVSYNIQTQTSCLHSRCERWRFDIDCL